MTNKSNVQFVRKVRTKKPKTTQKKGKVTKQKRETKQEFIERIAREYKKHPWYEDYPMNEIRKMAEYQYNKLKELDIKGSKQYGK